MLEILAQRLKSKTYWAAILGTLITVVDANLGVVSSMLPGSLAVYTPLLWPMVMVALREVTTTSIAKK